MGLLSDSKTNKKPDGDLLVKNFILNGCKNAKQAAIDAHYSPKTAEQSASRVLRSVKAKKAIEEYKNTQLLNYVWSKEDKLKKLEEIVDNCIEVCIEEGNFNKGKMNNPSAAIAALKEHSVMQGDNAPTKTELSGSLETVSLSKEDYAEIRAKMLAADDC